jgi:alpha-beta hydrolase superfamily lysophospholipase
LDYARATRRHRAHLARQQRGFTARTKFFVFVQRLDRRDRAGDLGPLVVHDGVKSFERVHLERLARLVQERQQRAGGGRRGEGRIVRVRRAARGGDGGGGHVCVPDCAAIARARVRHVFRHWLTRAPMSFARACDAMRAPNARGSVRSARSARRRAHGRACVASTSASASTFKASDGVSLEVRTRSATGGDASSSGDRKPTIVFVHGSYHAAWCYEEYFAPWFASRGYATASVSLRAHGSSEATPGSTVAGTLASHAKDLEEILCKHEICGGDGSSPRPVVVGHSFGGLVVQKALADDARMSAAILLASVPPTGNSEMVKRFLKRDLFASLKITYAFITKAFGTNPKLCRECFFSTDTAEEDVERFTREINNSSRLRMLDLKALNSELPVPKPTGVNAKVPVLVVGGDCDFVVDRQGLEETASWYDSEAGRPIVLPNTAHDVMLDTRWLVGAQTIEKWIETNVI